MRLEIEPPGRLRIGPAVHRRNHQVRAVLEVANDRDPPRPGPASDRGQPEHAPTPGLWGPQSEPTAGQGICQSVAAPDRLNPPRRESGSGGWSVLLRRAGSAAGSARSAPVPPWWRASGRRLLAGQVPFLHRTVPPCVRAALRGVRRTLDPLQRLGVRGTPVKRKHSAAWPSNSPKHPPELPSTASGCCVPRSRSRTRAAWTR
jgi:hypothetical protein